VKDMTLARSSYIMINTHTNLCTERSYQHCSEITFLPIDLW